MSKKPSKSVGQREESILVLVKELAKAKGYAKSKPELLDGGHAVFAKDHARGDHESHVEHATGVDHADAMFRLEMRLRLRLNAELALREMERTRRPSVATKARWEEALRLSNGRYVIF